MLRYFVKGTSGAVLDGDKVVPFRAETLIDGKCGYRQGDTRDFLKVSVEEYEKHWAPLSTYKEVDQQGNPLGE